MPRLIRPCPDDLEDANDYCLGGLHYISIGDRYSQGRYQVLHKLDYGSSSTVWLARDHHGGRLVALKALRADRSSSNNNELIIQKHLHIQTILDHFYVDGPNGTHLFIIYAFCGPNITMCGLLRVLIGTTRVRGDLAYKLINQLIEAVDGLHRAGVVHGDITADNLYFSLPSEVHQWTDAEVYDVFGSIVNVSVDTKDGTPLPPGAPAELIFPAAYDRTSKYILMLNESIVLGGFGQSIPMNGAVDGYTPRTPVIYLAPETHFEKRAGFEADGWQLGCAIYEIRAGGPLFDRMFYSPTNTLKQMVALLGRLPDPWWGQFEERVWWFSEDGKPKPAEGGNVLSVRETSIRKLLTSIGIDDLSEQDIEANPTFEKTGVRLAQREVELLGDLLEKMLRYKPEDRIKVPEVAQHPYLATCE